jgi:toxin CptA
MSKSRPWSNAFAPCRLEWRSSRLLAAALMALGALAGGAAIASELRWSVAVALAAASLAYGAWLGKRELSRPCANMVIPRDGDTAATIDGEAVKDLRLQWRGSLAFLQWRDARGRRLSTQGGPDNLDAATRRELRLAMAARVPARSPRSMAP